MAVWILRLGHRLPRDERVSTHCGLVARAFGAEGIIFSGEKDEGLVKSVQKIAGNWGGNFQARYEKNWRGIVRDFKKEGYYVILLTMYGVNLPEIIEKVRNKVNVLLIVGSEKVPGEVYELCDAQIAASNQPHSEIAALAVFLDHYFKGEELEKKFDSRLKIIPKLKGKEIKKV